MKKHEQEEVGEVESANKRKGGMTKWGKRTGKSRLMPMEGESSEAVEKPKV